MLAEALVGSGRPDDALRVLRDYKIAAPEPHLPTVLTLEAVALADAGREADALAIGRRLLSDESTIRNANLIWAYVADKIVENKKGGRALEFLNEIAQLGLSAYSSLCVNLGGQGFHEVALKCLSAWKEKSDDPQEATNNFVGMMNTFGRFETAVEAEGTRNDSGASLPGSAAGEPCN